MEKLNATVPEGHSSNLKEKKPVFHTFFDHRIEFIDGYGIVEFMMKKPSMTTIEWCQGIINDRGIEVLALSPSIKKIDHFGNGNFIVQQEKIDGPCRTTNVLHVRATGEDVAIVKSFKDSLLYRISEQVVIVTPNILYQVAEGKILSDCFDQIDPYLGASRGEEAFYCARKYVSSSLLKEQLETVLTCYIDVQGRIRTPLYSSFDQRVIDTSAPDFSLGRTVTETKGKLQIALQEREEGPKRLLTYLPGNNNSK